MIYENRSIDETVAFLNELARLDPQAMAQLIDRRVECNAALAEHPHVQVLGTAPSRVGLLGILNGLFGAFDSGPKAGWGAITAVYEDDGRLTFARTRNTP